MAAYILRRLLLMIPTLWAIGTLTFNGGADGVYGRIDLTGP